MGCSNNCIIHRFYCLKVIYSVVPNAAAVSCQQYDCLFHAYKPNNVRNMGQRMICMTIFTL
uniref:Uncharacterized protein n=1 Tax=Rhizophora mucronata TaxID=61149 RepID=A0A2P2MR48_RHIMU